MKVEKLVLERFTAFNERVDFDFCPGINVFIGANATGKSHTMKALYTLLKVCEQVERENAVDLDVITAMMQKKLMGVFKPDALGRLVRRRAGQSTAYVDLHSYPPLVAQFDTAWCLSTSL